jgi:dipeptidase D
MTQTDPSTGIEALEPAPVWRLFAGIAAVPRPSKHEERIRAHVRQTAQGLGFNVREDRAGNLVIEVPATPGCGNAPRVVLQGHLDMVCEKNAGTQYDAERDPIRPVLDKDPQTGEPIVRAAGTTLGADNGIGVAMALAAASSPEVMHGPLDILCTVDEEMGMTGAGQIEPGFVHGQTLLNLDTEEDDILYIGCAGGGDLTLTWELKARRVAKTREVARVTVSGLRGGHSGGDIHENRGNAIKALVRTLTTAGIDGLQIVTINGGSKRNAIPREAAAVVAGPKGLCAALQTAARTVRDALAHESAEPNPAIQVDSVDRQEAALGLSAADTQRLVLALTAIPSGVLEMHRQVVAWCRPPTTWRRSPVSRLTAPAPARARPGNRPPGRSAWSSPP